MICPPLAGSAQTPRFVVERAVAIAESESACEESGKLRMSLKIKMILCICQAVTSSEVDSAIEGGARSAAAVGSRCGAGTDCGACRGAIEKRIASGG